MIEFDHQHIENDSEENYIIEQLAAENAHLRRLLLIHDNHGVLEADIQRNIAE